MVIGKNGLRELVMDDSPKKKQKPLSEPKAAKKDKKKREVF